MKTRLLILIACCSGIRANPVDSTKLSNKKAETPSVVSKSEFVLKDEDFPALQDPAKPDKAPLERTGSVKDLVNFWEQKSSDNSRPSSPQLSRKPSVTAHADEDKKPVGAVGANDHPEKAAEAPKPVQPKVVAEIPKDDSSGAAPKQPVQTPKSDSASGGVHKSELVVSLKTQEKPVEKKAEEKPSSAAVDDLIITDLDQFEPKEKPKSVVPIKPIQNAALPVKPAVKVSDEPAAKDVSEPEKTPLNRRPSLPKEVQDELIATVAKKQAEKAAADEGKAASVKEDAPKNQKNIAPAVLVATASDEPGKNNVREPVPVPAKAAADPVLKSDAVKEAAKTTAADPEVKSDVAKDSVKVGAAEPSLKPDAAKDAANPALKSDAVKDAAKTSAADPGVKSDVPNDAVKAAPANPALKSEAVKDAVKPAEEKSDTKPAPVRPALKSTSEADPVKTPVDSKKETPASQAAVKKETSSDDDQKPVEDKGKQPAAPGLKSGSPSRTAVSSTDKKAGTAGTKSEVTKGDAKPAADEESKSSAEDKSADKKEGGFFKKIFG